MDMGTLRKLGKEKFGTACRVCRICDGTACAGEIPGMGGVSTGRSFINNLSALSSVKLRQRIIHEVGEPDTNCEFFGVKMQAPIIAAPIGGISYNCNDFMPEEDYAKTIVEGANTADCLAMTGDGGPPVIYKSGIEAITLAGGRGIPTIKPRPNEEIIKQAAIGIKAGAPAIAIDVDSAALINMTRMNQPVGPKSPKELEQLVEQIERPLIIKGVMTVEDAQLCLAAGVKGIVVSNHGGRVLDHTPGTAEVLPAIAAAVGGKMLVLVDGGIRTGTDVLKMLALGADAVMIGRPLTQAAAGGAQGVAFVLEKIITELKLAMIMTGVKDIAAINYAIIHKNC